jgi:hypothetical protein
MDRFNMNKDHKEIIGRACSKALSEVTEREKKIETLCDIKRNILTIKRLSKISNISNTEIIKLFEDCDFEFWKLKGMEEFVAALGIEDALIPAEEHINISDEGLTKLRYTIDEDIRQTENTIKEGENMLFNSDTLLQNNDEDEEFANRIINELDEKLSSMSNEERNEFFKRMGFIIEPETLPDLEKQVTPEGKKLANNITNELKVKLNSMTDQELETHLKELGFFQNTMPDNIKERAQINKKVKVKRISKI